MKSSCQLLVLVLVGCTPAQAEAAERRPNVVYIMSDELAYYELSHMGNPRYDTLDAADSPGPGNLRLDYVLPASSLKSVASGVFWPKNEDQLFGLVGTYPFPSSDHRLVWVDIAMR